MRAWRRSKAEVNAENKAASKARAVAAKQLKLNKVLHAPIRFIGKALKVLKVYEIGQTIYKFKKGADKVGEGHLAEGSVDMLEQVGQLMLIPIGTAAAKGGLAIIFGAALAGAFASFSVGLLAETARAAIKGQDTPIDRLDKHTGWHIGDIAGWVSGVYARP